jgi:NAD+ kinase
LKNTILFFANTKKQAAGAMLHAAMQTARELGHRCLEIDYSTGIPKEIRDDVFFLVVIGGDGTILESVRLSAGYGIPILGVNMGTKGFLSEIAPEEFHTALLRITKGDARVIERMMLGYRVGGGHESVCLNEVLLTRNPDYGSGTAQIDITIDGVEAGVVFCDGVIVCTPTGATGYSISAGGPIVADGLDVCVITPICAHSLTAKPIVAAAGAHIRLTLLTKGRLYADGQSIASMQSGDTVEISASTAKTKFIELKERNVFRLIKEKLR